MHIQNTVEIIVNSHDDRPTGSRTNVIISHLGESGTIVVRSTVGEVTLDPYETVEMTAVAPPRYFQIQWDVEAPDPLDQDARIWTDEDGGNDDVS